MKKLTHEEACQRIERLALNGLMQQATVLTKEDICRDCLDKRCEAHKLCKEFLRRSMSYAWELAAHRAELN